MIKKKQRTFLQKLTTLLMFSMVFAVGAWAQLTNGKVYNFESIGRAGKSLSSSDKCDNGQATTNHANPHQLWIAVEGKGKNQGKFVLRNLGNGLYLQSSQQKDKAWTMVPTIALDDSSYNYCVKKDGSSDIYVMSDNAQGTGDKCMHLLTDKVICGNSNDKNSQWRIKEVPKTDEEIKKQLEKVAKFENERTEYYRALIYEKTLYKIFHGQILHATHFQIRINGRNRIGARCRLYEITIRATENGKESQEQQLDGKECQFQQTGMG